MIPLSDSHDGTSPRLLKGLLYSFLAWCGMWGYFLRAEVRLPSVISDHMVVQEGGQVRLWGWADPAEKITIQSSWGQSIEGVADSGGRWHFNMSTPKAGGPHEVRIAGTNEHVVKDVMVGEVWLCSGQSNMEWSGRQQLPQSLEEGPLAVLPEMRFFEIPKTTSQHPQDQCEGRWKVCSPETMPSFSAVGYFFGKRLHQRLQVPVGLIGAYWGGTPAEVWTPEKVVVEHPALLEAAGELEPFAWWPKDPGLTYNAMIHPITPYRISGVIWYQGESNVKTASTYRSLFTSMIQSWRDAWQQESLPFYFVQIAPFAYDEPMVAARLREAQTQSLSLPETGMVVVSDLVDNLKDIHPVNKRDVGLRLAHLALDQTYGDSKAGPHQSPTYQSHEIRGRKVRIQVDHAAGGLVAREGRVTGFELAGVDRVFHPASVSIEGSALICQSDQVPQPVAVRFCFSNTAVPTLFSQQGMPLNAFRTDDW